MKIITFKDIQKINVPPLRCYEWVDEMLRHKDEVILPAKISLHLEDNAFFNVMPCLLPHSGAGGVKVITRKQGREPSLDSQILLYDYNRLEPLAMLDGNWITTMRTGAVAAHTIKHLANPDFAEIGVMGLGNTCRAALKVFLALYPDRKLRVKILKYKDQHTLFDQYLKEINPGAYANLDIVFVDTPEAVVRDSDVIISAVTYMEGDFCADACYKKGCLVVAIHLRGFMCCDLSFDRVYCDDTAHVDKFKYYDKWKFSAEVAQVIRGEKPGRQSADERIIAYNVGLSIHDINYAWRIYEMCEAQGGQSDLSLDAPTDKFWI